MYFDYLKEREGLETIADDFGFITYCINENQCFISDIYIKPEFRKANKGSSLVDKLAIIARDNNCKYLTARNYPASMTTNEAMIASLLYGFKIVSSNSEYITLAKEL